MNKEEVVGLMKSSKSEAEWNRNCATVKSSCGGYPDFWFESIITSGLIGQVAAEWGGNDQIRVGYLRNR